jgi:hypothetical protein
MQNKVKTNWKDAPTSQYKQTAANVKRLTYSNRHLYFSQRVSVARRTLRQTAPLYEFAFADDADVFRT